MGRPSDFTQEKLDRICDRLALGEPMAVICRDDDMPTDRTVRNWMERIDGVSSAIARAREVGFDAIATECLEIADETSNDTKWGGENGETRQANSEWISRSKLRVETRLKLLAKWDPKRYGERMELEHSGSMSILTPEQRQAEIDRLIAKRNAAE